ncbi:STAS domain-containing protein [Verrucomicrobia bacterium]|nr:STAS domain-containing protein [Verrucomicrobiota bacterium]MDG1855735.1 STAS domain-containing protein [Verrucomicrobiota bacterium]
MDFESTSERILVLGIKELTSANAAAVKDDVRRCIRPGHLTLDIDMSNVRILDSSGLGTLIALHKCMCQQNGLVRIMNPTPIVEQVLELTRLHRLLEITRQ